MFTRLSEFLFGKNSVEETPTPPPPPRPVLTEVPSPLKPEPQPEPELLTRNWSHPFGDRSNPLQQLTHLAKAADGYYPVGISGAWHGGVHFDDGTAGALDQSKVACLADGEVVAYRIPTQTPTTRYFPGPGVTIDAPGASGFVLVRHRIQAPAIEGCAETPPSLTFYSLYMHLQDWAAYEDRTLERPAFWVESEAKWVKEGKEAPDLIRSGEHGVRVVNRRLEPKTLGYLVGGTQVAISGEGDYRLLENSLGPEHLLNADGMLRGYVAVKYLGMRVGDMFLVNADDLNVRAESDPRSAVLDKLPRNTLVEVSGSGDMVKLERIEQYVPISALRSEYVPALRDQVFVPEKPIPIKAGELIGHIGPYQNSDETQPQNRLHLEVFCTTYFPKFLDASRAWADRLPVTERTWLKVTKGSLAIIRKPEHGRRFPAFVEPHHVIDADVLIPKNLIDNLPAANKIHQPQPGGGKKRNWYYLEGLLNDKDGTIVDGWVAEIIGETEWVSPWHWGGYEVISNSDSPTKGRAYGMSLREDVSKEDLDRLRPIADEWDQGDLQGRLHAILDRDGEPDGKISPKEIRTGLNIPAYAQSLSRIVLECESEWYYRQEKWDALDQIFGHTTSAPILNWVAEKERIKELSWWEDLMEPLNLPTWKAYFLHPLGLVGQFIVDDNDLCWLKVPFGQLTFDVEGNDIEFSRYFSRTVHWPGGASGVTIGRGYDLGQCPNPEEDLKNAGIKEPLLSWLLKSKGLKGEKARAYFNSASHQIAGLKITRKQQYHLFINVYQVMKDDVVRVSEKSDTSKKYGKLFWSGIHPKIRDIMVDLRFRGDYGTESRKFLQKPFINNDLEGFRLTIQDEKNWPNVPRNRFSERARYAEKIK
ncbi:hypothetical protein [Pseudomonas sp. zfem002]|uniref:hypothetical protein n=1 Tax=Pseudomonas sp. zfem002 TaxID=3078197 RepID=UPI002928E1C1|nr:hypothetical protein [Pseudomonas sp. zfem002]MDU9393905.1 hypothetical protein [Pseudomonas sp. zfem002]